MRCTSRIPPSAESATVQHSIMALALLQTAVPSQRASLSCPYHPPTDNFKFDQQV